MSGTLAGNAEADVAALTPAGSLGQGRACRYRDADYQPALCRSVLPLHAPGAHAALDTRITNQLYAVVLGAVVANGLIAAGIKALF